MSTNRRKTDLEMAQVSLSMRELAAVLVKHYGFTEGKFDLGIEFQIGTGPVGPNDSEKVPGVLLGVKSVRLAPAKGDTSTSIDASEISSPAIEKKPRSKKPVTA